MAITLLNLGTSANDGTGDSIRAGGQKINDNFTDVDTRVTTAQTDANIAQIDIDVHEADLTNPHQVTKTQVGLGNVDNTSDATKNSAVAVLTNKDLTSGTNTFPTFNQNTTGSAATLSPGRNIDGQLFDGSANITVIAPGTHAATSKTTPVDADEVPLVDSAASNILKKLTWANLKATLKTYLDTLYLSLGGGTLTGNLQLPAGSASSPSLQLNDANTGIYAPIADALTIVAGGNQATRISTGGQMFSLNGTALFSFGAISTPAYQFIDSSLVRASTLWGYWANNSAGPVNYFYKSRGTTVGTTGALVGNETIATLQFRGDDGVTPDTAVAEMRVSADGGTIAAGKIPGRITFSTADSSSGTLTERVRIDSTGALQMGGTNTVIGPLRHFQLRSYTVAGLPSAATAGQLIYVSNETGGATPAFSDGTNWRRVSDRAVVS